MSASNTEHIVCYSSIPGSFSASKISYVNKCMLVLLSLWLLLYECIYLCWKLLDVKHIAFSVVLSIYTWLAKFIIFITTVSEWGNNNHNIWIVEVVCYTKWVTYAYTTLHTQHYIYENAFERVTFRKVKVTSCVQPHIPILFISNS